MTEWPPASEKVTRGGETLSARMWAALEDAYRAADLDPAVYLVVTHGSWDHYSGSGSTHDGGGAADLRTWNLPASARENLCGRLVTELRRRCGLAVWYRDSTHGGMDPHIHVLLRDEPGLASGATWQVGEADAGRNGLSSGGPDYHPRPTWVPFVYPPITQKGDADVALIVRTHQDSKPDNQGVGNGRAFVVLENGTAWQIDGEWKADGVPVVKHATEGADSAFFSVVNERKVP